MESIKIILATIKEMIDVFPLIEQKKKALIAIRYYVDLKLEEMREQE